MLKKNLPFHLPTTVQKNDVLLLHCKAVNSGSKLCQKVSLSLSVWVWVWVSTAKTKPQKKWGALSQAKQRCSLSIWQERERERVRERKRIQRQRAQLRWKWNERVSERPAERIRNNRNGRLRARVTPSGAATPAEAEAATPAEQRIAVSSPFTWV